MNRNIDPNQRMTHAEYKKSIKRMWICLACLIPFILFMTVVFSKVGMPVWLAMLLNVIIGGLICLLVYMIFDKIDRKKKIKKLLEPKQDDPFSD